MLKWINLNGNMKIRLKSRNCSIGVRKVENRQASSTVGDHVRSPGDDRSFFCGVNSLERVIEQFQEIYIYFFYN